MDALPILIVTEADGKKHTLGQSHSILRFLAGRHSLMGATEMESVAVDGIYECVRDMKASWYKVKATPDDATRREAKERYWSTELPAAAAKLEAAVGAAPCAAAAAAGPWLVGARITLADIAVYHLLGTSTSLVSGSLVSFMDNEDSSAALAACPRLRASVDAVAALPAVQAWEERRPDTFT